MPIHKHAFHSVNYYLNEAENYMYDLHSFLELIIIFYQKSFSICIKNDINSIILYLLPPPHFFVTLDRTFPWCCWTSSSIMSQLSIETTPNNHTLHVNFSRFTNVPFPTLPMSANLQLHEWWLQHFYVLKFRP